MRFFGEMPEWSIGAVSKTVDQLAGPRVRIPVSPLRLEGVVELCSVTPSCFSVVYGRFVGLVRACDVAERHIGMMVLMCFGSGFVIEFDSLMRAEVDTC